MFNRSLKNSLAILILCICMQASLPAQIHYRSLGYGVKDGLSSELCRSMYKDKAGFLWITTDKGLNRYDGNSFYTFTHRPDDATSIANNSCNGMFEDSKNRFWINTDDGISLFDSKKQNFKNYEPDTTVMPVLGISYTDMAEDNKGRIWIGGYYDILIFDPKTEKFERSGWYDFALKSKIIKQDKRNSITQSIIRKSDTELWLMTVYGLFSVHTPTNKFTYYPNPSIEDYFAFVIRHIDDEGMLWIGTYDQCYYTYDPKSNKWLHHTCPRREKGLSDQIFNISKYDNENLIMTRSDSLYLFNKKTKSFNGLKWETSDEISNKTYYSQALYSGENIYILKTGSKPFVHLKKNNSPISKWKIPLPPNTVNNHSYITSTGKILTSDWDKNLILICDDKICDIIKEKNGKTEIGNLQLSYSSRSGHQYFSTSKNVYSYDENTKTAIALFFTKDTKNDQLEFRNFVEDKYGNIYARERSKGIYILKKGDEKLTYFDCGISGDNFSALYYDKASDKLWLAKEKGGLFIIDPTSKKYRNYSLLMLTKSDKGFIYDIAGDEDGNIFMTIANRGIVKINSQSMIPELFTTADGLISDAVKYGFTDNRNIFWFTSEAGLMAFDYKKYRFYSFEEESDAKLFSYRIFPDKSGNIVQNLYPEHMISFHKKSINSNESNSKIYLKEVKLFGKIIPNDTFYKVRYNQNNFVFLLGNLGLSELNSKYFQYRINNGVWQALENNNISLYNLSPGFYNIEVQHKFDEGKAFTVKVEVTPPWWKTLYFYAAVFSFTSLLIYFLYKRRISQIRKEEVEKNQLKQRISEIEMTALRAQMNPHFIFNCLNSINRFILVNDTNAASGYLTKFSRLIRMILDGSRENFISLDKEIEALRLYIEMESMRFQSSFEWTINIHKDVRINDILVPPLLLQPYVENAIWHGLMQATENIHRKLDININQKGNETIIEIADNGIGRDKARQLKSKTGHDHKSHGIALTDERLNLMHKLQGIKSTVSIEDLFDSQNKPCGTKVIITLNQT